MAGHDLRQPLQSLALTTRILSLDCTEAERIAANKHVGLAIESLDQMIVVLTEMARLGSGYSLPAKRRVRLDEVVAIATGDCAAAAARAGLSFQCTLPVAEIETDPRLLGMAEGVAALRNQVRYGRPHPGPGK